MLELKFTSFTWFFSSPVYVNMPEGVTCGVVNHCKNPVLTSVCIIRYEVTRRLSKSIIRNENELVTFCKNNKKEEQKMIYNQNCLTVWFRNWQRFGSWRRGLLLQYCFSVYTTTVISSVAKRSPYTPIPNCAYNLYLSFYFCYWLQFNTFNNILKAWMPHVEIC